MYNYILDRIVYKSPNNRAVIHATENRVQFAGRPKGRAARVQMRPLDSFAEARFIL